MKICCYVFPFCLCLLLSPWMLAHSSSGGLGSGRTQSIRAGLEEVTGGQNADPSLSLRAKQGASLEWRRVILFLRANPDVSRQAKRSLPGAEHSAFHGIALEMLPPHRQNASSRIKTQGPPSLLEAEDTRKACSIPSGTQPFAASYLLFLTCLLVTLTGTRFNGTLFRT